MKIYEDYTLNHMNIIIKNMINIMTEMHTDFSHSIQNIIYISKKGSENIENYSLLINEFKKNFNVNIPTAFIIVPKLLEDSTIQIESSNMMNWVYEQLEPKYINDKIYIDDNIQYEINGVYSKKSYCSLSVDIDVKPNTSFNLLSTITIIKNKINEILINSEFKEDNILSLKYYYINNYFNQLDFNNLPYPYNNGIAIPVLSIPKDNSTSIIKILLTIYNKDIIQKHILV